MATIKIDSNKSITQTIRLKESVVTKIDDVVKCIHKLTGENISKAFVIEQLILNGIESLQFDINNVVYSFDDLAKLSNKETDQSEP